MWKDWIQDDNNWIPITTDGVKSDYGFFHVYAFTMTLGMLVAILYSLWKFYRKDIPLTALVWAVIFVIPSSLFGASFFGKLNADGPGVNAGGVGFWGLFAFWKAGMAIHGGVYVSFVVGWIVVGIASRKTKISTWAYMDAIVPNVLLGQGIGRWGNFFNHEVMGAPVYVYGNTGGNWSVIASQLPHRLVDFNNIQQYMTNGYNSGIHLPHWLLNNTMSIYDGPETWIGGVHLQAGDIVQMSPIFFYESIGLLGAWLIITFVIPNIGKWIGKKPWKVQGNKYEFSIKASFIEFWNFSNEKKNPKSWSYIWNDAYYCNVDQDAKKQYLDQLVWIENSFNSKLKIKWKKGRALIKANNPNGYAITKIGAETGAYFFAWNFVRFILEMERPDNHLFIMYNKPLSLSLIGATALIGLLIIVISQIGIPEFFRTTNYVYEKEYFSLTDNKNETTIIEPKKEVVTKKTNQTKIVDNQVKKSSSIQDLKKAAKLEKQKKNNQLN